MYEVTNVVINHVIAIIIFFVIYSILFTMNKKNFEAAHGYLDMLYFTTTTQSSTGYGDIVPTTTLAKITVMMHQIVVIFIISQFIYTVFKQ